MLTPLADKLQMYDALDLLETAAGLQLMPENADRTLRLVAFAHAASSRQSHQRQKIDNRTLTKIFEERPLGLEIASQEDPLNNSFTEAFTFYGGSYVVFSGVADNSVFILKHLAKAIFNYKEAFPNNTFKFRAYSLIVSVLTISNEMARRAGLGRNVAPASDSRNVFIPNKKRFKQLKRAPSFSTSELQSLLSSQKTDLTFLESIVISLADNDLGTYENGETPLLDRPIIRIADQLVVAIPGRLLGATSHALIRWAMDEGLNDTLSARFNHAVWDTVTNSLNYLENTPISMSLLNESNIPGSTDGLFQFDADKLMYTLLITDRLDDYDRQKSSGEWEPDELDKLVEDRLEYVEQTVSGLPIPRIALCLVLIQSLGRWFSVGVHPSTNISSRLLLSMTAADLEVITLLEGGDPLVLWKYAIASKRIREHTRVLVFGELDEFYLYRSKDYSYYLSDEQRPTHINIFPDGGGTLYLEMLTERDWHAVPSHNAGKIIEVTTLHNTKAIPLYIPRSVIDSDLQQMTLLVKGLPLPCWIVGPVYQTQDDFRFHSVYVRMAETIGYWLWQFTPSLAPILQYLVSMYTILRINLILSPDEGWFIGSDLEANQSASPIIIDIDQDAGQVIATISSRITTLLKGPDNGGERLLMTELLMGLRELLPQKNQVQFTTVAIEAIIERYAPLGPKKIFLIVDSSVVSVLDDDGLPSYRRVQNSDKSDVLDSLGSYLQTAENLPVGPILDGQRTAILRKAVHFLYSQLEEMVATLDPSGLLEGLVVYHEAVVQSTALTYMTIPTRLACYSTVPEMVKQLQKEMPEYSEIAIANRFVIEYVTTKPPSGNETVSLSTHDRLQALASQIIRFGFDSDIIHYKLADIRLSMLPSGRLGTGRTAYQQALNSFHERFVTGEIVRATQSFSNLWHTTTDQAATSLDMKQRLDAVTMSEFGHSLSEILSLMAEAIAITDELNPVVACLPLSDFVRRLSDQLTWSSEKMSQVLDLVSLRPRTDFLRPSGPHRAEDVYPWRFNRGLSYLRRPFLQREKNGTVEVIWGKRHVFSALNNLIRLCQDGRLFAQSTVMKQFLGEMHNQRGERFNDQVADIVERNAYLVVRRRVKKLPGLRGTQAPPGDIDVLVANSATNRLYVVECKDLAVARTPHELANELTNLFIGQNGKPSIVERHQRRVEWVHSHLGEILAWLGCSADRVWSVEAMIVIDEELMSPHLYSSPIQIISVNEMSNFSF